MDLNYEARVAAIKREIAEGDRVYAEYRRLRHLMMTAPTPEERQAALEALKALGEVRDL